MIVRRGRQSILPTLGILILVLTVLARARVSSGGVGDALWLREAGFHGNSHMLMMDRNSDEIAALVQRWLAERGLMRQ